MFQESIAIETAEHFRFHIQAYLAEVDARFTGSDKLTLKVPNVTSATLVGGVMQVPYDQLPALGVDCMDKQEIPSSESLCYYQYEGAIAGVISGSSPDDVDRLVKRYAAATEKFVRDHQYLHLLETADYMMREFIYVSTSFSGAIDLQLELQEPLWVDAFTLRTLWITSEDQYRQH